MKKVILFNITKAVIVVFLTFSAVSCIEELPLEAFENSVSPSLVVEATFTNELKHHQVYLSRLDARLDLVTDTTYVPFITPGLRPRDTINTESGATIQLTTNTNQVFQFTEGNKGTYISNSQFSLQENETYFLSIATKDGAEYISEELKIAGLAEVTNIYAEKAISDTGVEGIAIYVDSSPLYGEADFYRLAYDETYKIIAPYWDDEEFVLTDYDPCALPAPTYDLKVVKKDYENQVCYNTVSSENINVFSTQNSVSSNVKKQLVRFIGKENFIISHRYSILVKQYVETLNAYSFFNTLQNFSQSDNVLSQVQPGTLKANIKRVGNANELVLGYVDAVSVSEKRMFFNYTDFYPNEELPPYPFNCNLFTSSESHISYCFSGPTPGNPCPQSVIENVFQDIVTYYAPYSEDLVPLASCTSDYVFTPRICGDCRLLGKNIVPDFWEE